MKTISLNKILKDFLLLGLVVLFLALLGKAEITHTETVKMKTCGVAEKTDSTNNPKSFIEIIKF